MVTPHADRRIVLHDEDVVVGPPASSRLMVPLAVSVMGSSRVALV